MRIVQPNKLVLVMTLSALLIPLVGSTKVNKVNQQQQQKQQQKQQLRIRPKPSSSGLPVPDLLESPDAKYDPKPSDIDNNALRLKLKDHFDERFMSVTQPRESVLHPNGTTEYSARRKNNLTSPWKPKLNIGSLKLPDGTKLRDRMARKMRKKLEQFLWLYTQCPVIYRWKDLGPRYWPRWVKQGRCHSNQSCSFPPGMSCRAAQEREVVILRWHCQRWDPPRYCKWIPMHYPIVVQCQCDCIGAKQSP